MHAAQVLVERGLEVGCGGSRDGHGNAEHGVGSELALVFGTVELDHGAVDLHLFEGIHPADFGGDDVVDVLDGLGDALAEVSGLVPVAKFDGLVDTRGCSGRHGGAAQCPVLEDDVHLDGGIAARIQDFAGFDVFDYAHVIFSFCVNWFP